MSVQLWVIVVGLLALSAIFFFISLFLKDNNYEEELDEISESLLELNREIYSLKKQLQELEEKNKPAKSYVSGETTSLYTQATTALKTPLQQEEEGSGMDVRRLHNITKQHIITLYSHGNTFDQIAEQLNVPVTTVQLVVDNYFEQDAE